MVYYELLDPQTCTVHSSAPCSDGHEVQNLFQHKTSYSFMAERFVRPPVVITIRFFHRINLKCLLLKISYNEQRLQIFEIFTSSKVTEINNDFKIFRSASSIWRKVLYSDIKDYKTDFIFAHDNNCDSSYLYQLYNGTNSVHTCQFLKLQPLSRIRQISIIILRVRNAGIPALSFLSLMGNTCSRIPNFQLQPFTVESKSFSYTVDRKINNEQETIKNDRDKHTDTQKLALPHEFYDETTCELMTMPMILPSGKTVDKLTIEKYNEIEKYWGRSPRDPFTGIIFTEKLKPILNAALKTRIDHFTTFNHCNSDLKNLSEEIERSKAKPQCIGRKRCVVSNRLLPNFSSKSVANFDADSKRPKFSKDEKCEDLDNIRQLLKGFPSFTDTFSNDTKQTETSISCSDCYDIVDNVVTRNSEVDLPSSDLKQKNICNNLYAFDKCLHVICRNCLLLRKNEPMISCRNCGKISERTKITRFYNF